MPLIARPPFYFRSPLSRQASRSTVRWEASIPSPPDFLWFGASVESGGRRHWRPENNVVLARDLYYLGRVRHIVDALIKLQQLACRSRPEEGMHGLAGVVVERVLNAAWHANEVASTGGLLLAGQNQVDLSIEHIDVLVLKRMGVRRYKGFFGEGCMPGKAIFARLLGHVHLAQNVPAHAIETGVAGGDFGGFFFHDQVSSVRVRRSNV